MPLAHFTNIHTATYHTGEPVYLPEKVLCFGEHESEKRLTFSKNFFMIYPFGDKEKEKYLKMFKSVIFQEDDKFRTILLNEKPTELKMKVYDKEGNVIRELTMYETEYKITEENELEVELRFKNYEDKYF